MRGRTAKSRRLKPIASFYFRIGIILATCCILLIFIMAKPEKVELGHFCPQLKVGIVGFPNVGKTVLFNALTQFSVPDENFPFVTIESNMAEVSVPDERFEFLSQFCKSDNESGANILEVYDLAALLRDSHKGAGIGNGQLSEIRPVDVIFHVLRAFEDPNVMHVEHSVDPVRDLEVITEQLRFKDLDFLKVIIVDLEKYMANSNDMALQEEHKLCLQVRVWLEEGKDVHSMEWNATDIAVLNSFQLLTGKPVVYLVNMSEKDYQRKENKFLPKIQAWVKDRGGESIVVPFSGSLEKNLAHMSQDDYAKYCKEKSICIQSALEEIIKAGFLASNLVNFSTTRQDEVNSWKTVVGQNWFPNRSDYGPPNSHTAGTHDGFFQSS